MNRRFVRAAGLFVGFAVLFLGFGSFAEADQFFLSEYIQTSYREESPIPVPGAGKILQTRDGYIWVASQVGLARFDGQRSKMFGRTDGSLPTNNIDAIFEDSKGVLWIGTSGGLSAYKDGKFTHFRGLLSVRSITEGRSGEIFAATATGVARVSREGRISPVMGPENEPILASRVATSLAGDVWCVLLSGSALVLSGENSRRLEEEDFEGLRFESVYCSRDGGVYLGSSENKIVAFASGSPDEWTLLNARALSMIDGINEDHDGKLWVCARNGIGYFDREKPRGFHHVDGTIVSGSFGDMIQDREGNYWFASPGGGVLQFTKAKFRDLFFAYKIRDMAVNAVTKYRGNLYMGTDDGLIVVDEYGGSIANSLTALFSGVRISGLLTDAEGNLWICAYQKLGLTRCDANGKVVSLTENDGLPGDTLRSACLSADGGVILAMNDGIAVVRGDRVIKTYTRRDGIDVPVILSVAETRDGTILAGSDGGGIYRIQGGFVTKISEAEGLSSNVVFCVVLDEKNDCVWVGTEKGISRIAEGGKGAAKSSSELEPYGDGVYDIRFENGNLWSLAPNGVYVCKMAEIFSTSGKHVPAEFLGFDQGLRSLPVKGARSFLDEDGALYIPCGRGVSVINTGQPRKNAVKPLAAVNSLSIDGETFDRPDDDVFIPKSASRVTVDFALLSYGARSKNSMSVFLEGFDEHPTVYDLSATTTVSYTNLKGGDYTLHLSGINGEGVESDELALTMNKELRFYERPILWLGLFFLIAAGAWRVVKWRVQHATKRKDRLLIAVNGISALLISSRNPDRSFLVWKALEVLARSVNASSAALWRNETLGQASRATQIAVWNEGDEKPSKTGLRVNVSYSDLLPEWSLASNRKIVRRRMDALRDTGFFVALPVTYQGLFWGFVRFSSDSAVYGLSREQEHILFSGGLLLVSSITRDGMITRLIEAEKMARAGERAKTEFLARMSHEIRTPLNAIIGLSEVELLNDLSWRVKETLKKIHHSGRLLLSLVNDLLDLSKIESGNFEIKPADYDSAALIGETVQLNIVRTGSKDIAFKLLMDETLPRILRGDRLRIEQILNNLLSNAFKYTNAGTVTLRVAWSAVGNDASLRFSVADTGIGIKEKDMARLFSDYSRLENSVDSHVEGTGLGLSIAKRLLDLMGGEISVESEFGAGSVFSFSLPQTVVDWTPVGAAVADDLENFRFTKAGKIDGVSGEESKKRIERAFMPYGKVLIVDDVQTNLDVLVGLLRPYGIEVECVTSGREAIEKVRAAGDAEEGNGERRRFDLIFMDHMMPVMDGVEATRIIRTEIGTEYARTVPIVALTANAVVGVEEMFAANGFNGFISKPIDLTLLNETLNRWIRDRQSEETLRQAEEAANLAGGMNRINPAEHGELLNRLEEAGLDTTSGVLRYGDEESYIRVLRSYVQHTPALLEQLRRFSKEDLEGYAIIVHGFKGSSYGVCATEAAHMAEKLEYAAKAGDYVEVAANNGRMIKFVEKFTGRLKELLDVPSENTARKQSAPFPDKTLLGEALNAARRFNTSRLERIISDLEQYDYETGGELVTWLREQNEKLDYDAIVEKLAKLNVVSEWTRAGS